MSYLPVSKSDMEARGLSACDFVYVIGDAYVDHPSFGHAIISRVLESAGYSVGIIAQPDWRDPKSVCALGEPRLGFLVTAGNMDSMVNHLTAAKKRRHTDAYSEGGEAGKRPDNATVVYCNLLRRSYKRIPIVIGGVEASLRRLSHYDYWSDRIKRSVLLDSQADILVYGMGERAIVEVADALASGLDVSDISFIDGTAYRTRDISSVCDAVTLPDYGELLSDRKSYARSFALQYQNTDPFSAKRLIEPYPQGEYVVVNPPQPPLTTQELDDVYELPYMREPHPSYKKGVPAIEEVRFSITSHRGCFGSCNFCSIVFHQGRIVQARSHASILREAALMTKHPLFKGYISDVGGPTANFRHPACAKQGEHGACAGKRCLYPKPCANIDASHEDYAKLLSEIAALPGVKKVFVRSGIRFDYLLCDSDDAFLRQLVEHHISGQLRLAPEHVSDGVLRAMGKPPHAVYERFKRKYDAMNEKTGKKQYIVPYLMSSHPGCTMKDAVELAEYVRDMGYNPEQVQDFYPTPSTVSTCMYATGIDPLTGKSVYVPRSPEEKAMQRALIQYRDPKNRELVERALTRAGRRDLIGGGEKCLLRPGRGGRSRGGKR